MAEAIRKNDSKKVVLKFLLSDIQFATRDLKEISLLNELNFKTMVLCVGEESEIEETSNGIIIRKIPNLKLSRSQTRIVRAIKIIRRKVLLIGILRDLRPTCISCHDIDALLLGWISTILIKKSKRPLLVYDSHEFEAGRNTNGSRGKIANWLVLKLERFLIKRTVLNIMVNDVIAEEVRELHHLKEKPLVIRNIPRYFQINELLCHQQKKAFYSELGLQNETFLVMYHGAFTHGRGIENLLKAITDLQKVAVILLGFGEQSYISHLTNLISSLKIQERVCFIPAVSQDELWKYVGAVDVGMVLIENVCKSYYNSLPNKLFENIQAETPVIGSNFPEIRKIIETYQIGICCDPSDPESIAREIKRLQQDKEQYTIFKQNLKHAKKELCWENEKLLLAEAYSKILNVKN
ncbi:MAG: glycosyltransferase [Sphingobacteriia bacterium]|nr:glycosyltransferase [Sphingobacteriia bacterium]